MQKIELLQPEIENILLNIDFIQKYKEIWERYNVEDDDYKISPSDIINTFDQLGYVVSKSNSDQYFSDFFECNSFSYRIGINIKYNIVHFDISIRNEKLNIKSGGSFGLLVQLMTNWGMPINSPGFYNLESFYHLINDLIELFDEIKTALEKHYELNRI